MSLTTCSDSFKRGINWLELNLEKTEILAQTIPNNESMKDSMNDGEKPVNSLQDIKYGCFYIEFFDLLSKINSPLVEDFQKAALYDEFWDFDWLVENVNTVNMFIKLGLGDNVILKEVIEQTKKDQTVEGFLPFDIIGHTGSMWALYNVNKNSKEFLNALNYWSNFYANFQNEYEIGMSSLGIIVLYFYDDILYKKVISSGVDFLKRIQNNEGMWGTSVQKDNYRDSFYSIWALILTNGINDPSVCKCLDFIRKEQLENGSWNNNTSDTMYALNILLSVGEGPKISVEFMNNQMSMMNKKLEKSLQQ